MLGGLGVAVLSTSQGAPAARRASAGSGRGPLLRVCAGASNESYAPNPLTPSSPSTDLRPLPGHRPNACRAHPPATSPSARTPTSSWGAPPTPASTGPCPPDRSLSTTCRSRHRRLTRPRDLGVATGCGPTPPSSTGPSLQPPVSVSPEGYLRYAGADQIHRPRLERAAFGRGRHIRSLAQARALKGVCSGTPAKSSGAGASGEVIPPTGFGCSTRPVWRVVQPERKSPYEVSHEEEACRDRRTTGAQAGPAARPSPRCRLSTKPSRPGIEGGTPAQLGQHGRHPFGPHGQQAATAVASWSPRRAKAGVPSLFYRGGTSNPVASAQRRPARNWIGVLYGEIPYGLTRHRHQPGQGGQGGRRFSFPALVASRRAGSVLGYGKARRSRPPSKCRVGPRRSCSTSLAGSTITHPSWRGRRPGAAPARGPGPGSAPAERPAILESPAPRPSCQALGSSNAINALPPSAGSRPDAA